jgi:hypothetical protein
VQQRYTWGPAVDVRHLHRGTPIDVEVPSKKEWVVDLRLREPIARPRSLPDLAVGSRDIRLDGNTLHVSVHNIGGEKADAFDVSIELKKDGRWHEVKRSTMDGLPAITRFEPVIREQVFELDASLIGQDLRVVVDTDQQVDEIYELNNTRSVVRTGQP